MLNQRVAKKKGKSLIFNRLFSGGIWMLIGRVSTLLLGLAVSGFLARILIPEDMGNFVFVESLMITAAMFAQLGLGHTSVRLIARCVAKADMLAIRKTLTYILQWGTLGSILAASVVFLMGSQIGIPEDVVLWTSIWVVIYAAQQLLADIFRGFQDFRSVVLIGGSKMGGIITTGVAAILLYIIWQIYGNLELKNVFPFLLIGGIPAILFAAVSLLRKVQLPEKTTNTMERPEIIVSRKEILWIAFPILITTLTTTFLNKSGIWIIAIFRPSAEVAIFGVVARLVGIISLPMNFFETLISPTIADLYTVGLMKKIENLLRSATTVLSLFSISILIAFVLFGSDILDLVYGDFYRSGANVLIILISGNVVSVVTGPCGVTLVMTGNQNTLMRIDIISSILSIILMFALVHPMGIFGVAVAIAISTIIKNIMMLLSIKKLTGIWTHATLRLDRRIISDLLK